MVYDRPGPWITRGTPRKISLLAALEFRAWKTAPTVCIECGEPFIPWRKDQVYQKR